MVPPRPGVVAEYRHRFSPAKAGEKFLGEGVLSSRPYRTVRSGGLLRFIHVISIV
jgi:hypothetical protein